MNAKYWLFGGEGRDKVVSLEGIDLPDEVWGEELIECSAEEAASLSEVPVKYRWEAAQGDGWTPSKEYAAFLRG